MSAIDWTVLFVVLGAIAGYGTWKSRGSNTMQSYARADNQVRWKAIGLSIMATQASAITFLSTPGQAFADGMRYIQLYFGLPLAMIILSATILPRYVHLKVFTAYEFLEARFDVRVRLLTASLFLIQRGMATGLNIVAPAIVLSAVLSVSLTTTTFIIGGLTILYTTLGGAKAVAQTQKLQMAVMLGGMVFALGYTIELLPSDVTLYRSLSIAGVFGKLQMVDFSFDPNERYTFWSGVTGGLFLALSYFGTDQSQVQRYISGTSLTESRLGLLFNAVLKLPLQFLILMCGVMVFVFYQFEPPPISFAPAALTRVSSPTAAAKLQQLESKYLEIAKAKSESLRLMLTAENEIERERFKEVARAQDREAQALKATATEIVRSEHPGSSGRDTDFVFISFILKQLPVGFVGLLVAMIFCGAMSTASAELNSLGTTSVLDFYARLYATDRDQSHYVGATRVATAFWGFLAMLFALTVPFTENLIQTINIIGSLFYGVLLGIFLLALSSWKIRSSAVVAGSIVAECLVIMLHISGRVGFLWYNVVGCVLVVALAWLYERIMRTQETSSTRLSSSSQ
ncbi:MAG: sodium:solute symporter [Bdellovibrionota bacterium]